MFHGVFQRCIPKCWRSPQADNNLETASLLLRNLGVPTALLYEVPKYIEECEDKLFIPIGTTEFVIGSHPDCDFVITGLREHHFKLSYISGTTDKSARWKVSTLHEEDKLLVNKNLRHESALVPLEKNCFHYSVSMLGIRATPESPWREFHFIANLADYTKMLEAMVELWPMNEEKIRNKNHVLERKLKNAAETFKVIKSETAAMKELRNDELLELEAELSDDNDK